MKKTACLLLSVLLLLGIAACSDPKEEEVPLLMKNLNAAAIKGNEEKVISTPTFTLDKSVKVNDGLFWFELLFCDGMTFQANAVVRIWGECGSDGGIAAEVGGQISYGTVENGTFDFYLAPLSYGTYTLNLYASAGRTFFEDVLFGEVYVMAGQSNMGMTVSECLDPEREESVCVYRDLIDAYSNDLIRYTKVWPSVGDGELDGLNGKQGQKWVSASKRTIADMSAVGFFFAKRMYEIYGIPVGFIQSCMGGTYTVPWIPKEEASLADLTYAGDQENNKPSCRFNTMIFPLRKFVVRGVVWYQGEGQDVALAQNTGLVISGWRRAFSQPLCFHIVGMPRYIAGSYQNWFDVREEQKKLEEIDGVSRSVNVDRGIFARDAENGRYNPGILGADGIHPPDKEPVGTRAADAFAKKFYNAPGVLNSPVLTNAAMTADGVLLTYDAQGGKLKLRGRKVGFEVSETGNLYTHAEPMLVGECQVLLKGNFSNVRYVRYGYTYSCADVFGNTGIPDKIENLVCLYNAEGYPADQFLLELD